MRKLIEDIKNLGDIKNKEFIEGKLCQLIQLIKEADKDRGKSKLIYEYNVNKLNIRVIYDISNYFKGVK